MFGERLMHLRKSRKMTQRELASLLNVSHTSVGKYERNEAEPDLESIRKISKIFNVSIDYLLSDEEYKSYSLTESDRQELLDAFSKVEKILEKLKWTAE